MGTERRRVLNPVEDPAAGGFTRADLESEQSNFHDKTQHPTFSKQRGVCDLFCVFVFLL